MSEGRHEGRCDRCGGANPVWVAPSPLWNEVMRTDGVDLYPFCCPTCFAQLAEMCGAVSDRTVWHLRPDARPVVVLTDDHEVCAVELNEAREALAWIAGLRPDPPLRTVATMERRAMSALENAR